MGDKQLVIIAYVLHGLGPFGFWLSGVAGAVINYLKRYEAAEPWRSHHNWLIRTFWIGLIGTFVGALLSKVLIGIPLLLGTMIWWLYIRNISRKIGTS